MNIVCKTLISFNLTLFLLLQFSVLRSSGFRNLSGGGDDSRNLLHGGNIFFFFD